MEYERAGAAFRRRERQLRSWLRHERMTVRVELAAALHHSAGPDTNDAVRSQKTVSSRGARPGVLQDPAPQLVSENAACPCSSGVPSLSLPVLADRAAEVVDSSSLRFLTASALEARSKEEEEKKKEKEKEKRLAVHVEAAVALERARLLLEQAGKRRKRKKRRKKKLPKASSSRSSCASHAARTRISGRSSTRPLCCETYDETYDGHSPGH